MSWVAGAFFGSSLEGLYILPYRVHGVALHFIQVALEAWNCTGFRFYDYALLIRRLHPLLSPTPYPSDTEEFVGQVWSILIRIHQIIELVPSSGSRFDVPIELLHVFRIVGSVGAIPGEVVAFGVVEQIVRIIRVAPKRQPLGVCASPNHLAAKLIGTED